VCVWACKGFASGCLLFCANTNSNSAPLLPNYRRHGTWGPEHSNASPSPKGGSVPTTPKAGGIVGGSFGRDGAGASLFSGGGGETPRYFKAEKRTAVEEVGVLGTVADCLKDGEEIAASILVVHRWVGGSLGEGGWMGVGGDGGRISISHNHKFPT
jgi:hypothetical protein